MNVLRECHATLEEKLGRCHRYTAWVLEKIAIIQVDDGCPGDALGAIDECLDILKRVYGDNDGKVQVGGTLKLKGKLLRRIVIFCQSCLSSALRAVCQESAMSSLTLGLCLPAKALSVIWQ